MFRTKKSLPYCYELLNRHFGPMELEQIVTSSRQFPLRMRADLQKAVERLFSGEAATLVGVHRAHDFDQLSISALYQRGRDAKLVGPLRYDEVDVGEDRPVRCLLDALWCRRDGDLPHAVLITRRQLPREEALVIEIGVPAGEAGSELIGRLFSELEAAVRQSACYRGKILSLEQSDMYSGMSSGITVHRIAPLQRDEVILPEATTALLERNILEFAAMRPELKRLKRSTKKGLLFYGPPGTGKTHTIRYLANCLPDHTTLLITAEQLGLIAEYFALARLLQPAMMVLEDVDLIARDRTTMDHPVEEVLLNKLLNEMDGLREDADIFFILTTNRPQSLEAALASRPGRIDQAIEFPLPDEPSRRKLVRLYGAGLEVAEATIDAIVERTAGVSPAFIRELMRRAAQGAIRTGSDERIEIGHIRDALEEMLFSGGVLNRKLLGLDHD